jgi:hypothetical protein
VAIEVVYDDGSSRVAVAGRIVAQVREGRLTLRALDRMLELWQTRLQPLHTTILAMFVIGENAEMPEERVRARQRAVLEEVGRSASFRSAIVVEGSGIYVQLRRVLLRSMTGHAPIFYTAREAAEALAADEDEVSADEIVAVVDAARGTPVRSR